MKTTWAGLRAYRTEILTVAVFAAFILAHPRAQADEVRSISRGEDSLQTFVSTISQAKRSIDVTTFIFGACSSSGQVVLNELRAAALRGVRVRVLLDEYILGDETIANLAADFKAAKIQFKVYNPGFRYFPTYNPRTHVKLLVADGSTYIAGGRNLSDEYFGLNETLNFVDEDLLVKGAAAKSALAFFNELWNSRYAVVATPGAKIPWTKFCRAQGDGFLTTAEVLADFRKSPAKANPVHRCDDVTYYQDSPAFLDVVADVAADDGRSREYMSGERLTLKRVTNAYAEFLRGTTKRLEAVNWSYIPTGLIRQAFDELRLKKIPVQVLTNRDPEGDGGLNDKAPTVLTAAAAKRDSRGSQSVVLVSGHGSMNDKHVLTPKTANFLIHAKTVVRDGRDVLIGSFNLDPRSTETNLENVTIVRNCPSLAAELHDRAQSIRASYVADSKKGGEGFEAGILTTVYSWLAFHFL